MGLSGRAVIDDVSVLAQTFAAEFTAHAADSIARRGKFVVGLPGGSVATTFLPLLAAQSVDWRRIDLFWIDERAVPPDHPDSNYGIASKLLLAPARVPGPSVHRMHGELPDLELAARRASDDLTSIAGDPPRLDLALVGVGPDGHVASIFPGVVAPSASSPVIAIYDAPKPPSRRLTMTLPVLADAGVVVVAAFGASKMMAMRGALDESDKTSPVARLLSRASSSLVLLDREAGHE